MSRKWPRWLVPNCVSNPSAVLPWGAFMTPALLTSPSSRSCRRRSAGANPRTESRLPRSSSSTSADPRRSESPATASSPAETRRHAATTCAPWVTSCVIVASPAPELAPVTTYTRPPRSRVRSAGSHIRVFNMLVSSARPSCGRGSHARRRSAPRTLSGVSPVHAWNARKNELGSSKPSRNEISAPVSAVVPR